MADPTSATPGYLRPTPTPAPLYGLELNEFFQAVVVGITGLDGDMVRPSFQAEAPNIPDAGEVWCAIRTVVVPADTFPAQEQLSELETQVQTNEKINILASFYDTGTNGQADRYCSILRTGLVVAQNREALFRAQMGLNSYGDKVTVPLLIKTRWQYRVDLPFVVSRNVVMNYRVESVLSAQGTIATDDGIELNIDVQPPPAP